MSSNGCQLSTVEPLVSFVCFPLLHTKKKKKIGASRYKKKKMVPSGIEAKLASHDRINIKNVAIEKKRVTESQSQKAWLVLKIADRRWQVQ